MGFRDPWIAGHLPHTAIDIETADDNIGAMAKRKWHKNRRQFAGNYALFIQPRASVKSAIELD
jgi:hypothetical protein